MQGALAHFDGLWEGLSAGNRVKYEEACDVLRRGFVSPPYGKGNPYERPMAKRTGSMHDVASKSHLFKDTRKVTEDKDKAKHMCEAQEVLFPSEYERAAYELPQAVLDALDFVVEKCTMKGGNIVEWRREKAATLRQVAETLNPINEMILGLKRRPEAAERIPTKYHFALVAAMSDSMGWVDEKLAWRLYSGFDTAGDMEDSRVYRPIEFLTEKEFSPRYEEVMDPIACAEWLDEMTRDICRNGERARLAGEKSEQWKTLVEIDKATKKEMEKGLCSSRMSKQEVERRFGVGGLPKPGLATRVIPRFGIEQGAGASRKIRVVDDCTKSKANSATNPKETIVLPTVESPAMMAAAVAEICETRKVRMQGLKIAWDDFYSAYRLIPARDARNSVIAYFSPEFGTVVFHQVWGHSFGLVSAVINFNRVPEMYCNFMHRFFAVAIDHYVDDFFIVGLWKEGRSGQEALSTLCALTGSPLAPEKRRLAGERNNGLGTHFDLSEARDGFISVRPLPERIDKVIDGLQRWRDVEGQTVHRKVVESLIGKLGFTLSAVSRKAGRGAMQPLFLAASSQKTYVPWCDDLEGMLVFLKILLDKDRLPPRRFDVRPAKARGRHVVVYTDSSGAGTLGLVLMDLRPREDGTFRRLYATAQIPAWLLRMLGDDQSVYINQFELIAILVADLTFEKYIRDRSVYHFVDNTSAMSAVVNGYSGKPEMAKLANMICLASIRAQTCKFYEYVASQANVSDLPSRPRPVLSAYPTAEQRDACRVWDETFKKQWEDCFVGFEELKSDEIVFPTVEQWEDPAMLLPLRSRDERESKVWDRRAAAAVAGAGTKRAFAS
jgi:hypothetical protein